MSRYPARLMRLFRSLPEHLAEPWPLSRAARVAGLERTYFCTFFRARVGMTFGEWLRRLRVRTAIEVMATTGLSVTETARAVGFRDLRTCQRAFRRYTGATPRAFKAGTCAVANIDPAGSGLGVVPAADMPFRRLPHPAAPLAQGRSTPNNTNP